jgi:hypothetical protein
MYHENRCIQEQSTAGFDALLAGLTCRARALLRRVPLAVARRAAVRQCCEGVVPRVRRAQAPSPRADARSECASRSRKPMTNRARIRLCRDGGGAWNVRAKASHFASVVRVLRAPREEAESALSVHESVKPASAPSQACRAAIRRPRRSCLARGTFSWR